MITLIAAAADDNAIGKGSNLLWHLPKDFKHFKNLTTGHCIIMGRKTFETFPKLLPQRTHIVITRQRDYTPEGVIVVGYPRGFADRLLPLYHWGRRNLCTSPSFG